MTHKQSNRVWLGVFLLLTLAVLALGVRWAWLHPYPTGWDEAGNINKQFVDTRVVASGNPLTIARHFLTYDRLRPPAYRMLTTPVLAATGVTPFNVRLVAGVWFVLALTCIGLAVNRAAGTAAAGLAVALVTLGPQVSPHVFRFGTEYSLMLGIALTLWGAIAVLHGTPARRHWIGLSAGLAIGVLSKLSFGPIMVIPALGALLWTWRHDRDRFKKMLIAGGAAALVAMLWYGYNVKRALWYASFAGSFDRHRMPDKLQYPELLARAALGEPLTLIAIALLVLAITRRHAIRLHAPSHDLRRLAWLLVFAPLPMIVAHVMSENQNPRFMGPSLAVALIGLSLLTGWALETLRARHAAWGLCFVLLVAQALAVFAFRPYPDFKPGDPWRYVQLAARPAYYDYPQWDWDRLHSIVRQPADRPLRLATLGLGPAMNPRQIEFPWARRAQPIDAHMLYSAFKSDEPFDPDAARDQAARYDYVIVALDLLGDAFNREYLENRVTGAFSEKLRADSRFLEPLSLQFSGQDPATVLVFPVAENVRRDPTRSRDDSSPAGARRKTPATHAAKPVVGAREQRPAHRRGPDPAANLDRAAGPDNRRGPRTPSIHG